HIAIPGGDVVDIATKRRAHLDRHDLDIGGVPPLRKSASAVVAALHNGSDAADIDIAAGRPQIGKVRIPRVDPRATRAAGAVGAGGPVRTGGAAGPGRVVRAEQAAAAAQAATVAAQTDILQRGIERSTIAGDPVDGICQPTDKPSRGATAARQSHPQIAVAAKDAVQPDIGRAAATAKSRDVSLGTAARITERGRRDARYSGTPGRGRGGTTTGQTAHHMGDGAPERPSR